ncbi:MAG: hypothetical protein ACYTDT_11120 [Planctomycetota bacterium]|jgi:hypothetical protein
MSSRFSILLVCTALIVGLAAGAGFNFSSAEAQPATEVAEAPKTAYVDFLSVLKNFSPLQRDQAAISLKLELALQDEEADYGPKIKEASKIMEQQKPQSKKYRDAMDLRLSLQHELYEAQLQAQQAAQADLRDAGIEWFGKLKADVSKIAKQKGYTQVLNIVLDLKAVAAREDLKVLQQQLLVSPVLYFEKEHDITEAVEEYVTEKWGLHISFTEGKEIDVADAEGKPFAAATEAELKALDLSADDADFIVKFGTKLKFKANVLKKDQPATGKDAEVSYRRIGIGGGEIDREGNYTAPEDFPRNTDIIEIRVTSKMDPQVQQSVKLLIVDSEGKRKKDTEPEDG